MAIISFAVWIQNCKTAICLHYVWFDKKTCFSCTTSTYDQHVQVPSVLMRIETDPHILSKYLVHEIGFLSVLPVHGCGIAPLCRAVFLASPVIATGGEPDADTHGIYKQTK